MEHIEAMAEGEWSSFSGIFSTEENDFMAQLLGNYSIPNEQELGSILSLGMPSEIWSGREAAMIKATGGDESSYYCSDTVNPSLICYPQSSSYSSGSSGLYYLSNSSPILMSNSCSMSMDLSMVHEQNNNSSVQIFAENPMEEGACFNEEMSSDQSGASPEALHGKKLHLLKRKLEMPESDTNAEDKFDTNPSEYPRKKSRVPRDVQRKKNVQSKKNQKLNLSSNDEEEINANTNGQSSSSTDCSEDDSNGGGATTSGSKGSVALNLNGKTRASRGSATDPQSLYARKRRERINERLRILQNLVPNGTKVDISTMLEEAVEYVKFLQLQIKLLSSDDMWMYAPIAYNGMDIGLDLKISNSR